MKTMFISILILFVMFIARDVNAQAYDPWCIGSPYGFPWCYNPPPWMTPRPSSTPIPTITPSPTPTVTASPSPTAVPTATPEVTPTPIPSTQPVKIKLGAYIADGIENLTAVDQFESLTGKNLSVILVYQAWEGDWKNFRSQWLNNAAANNSVAMITWEPWNYQFGANQWNYSLFRIANGAHDAHIRQYARDAKINGKMFYLRPMHEMNGNWYPWAMGVNNNTPAQYVQAWKRIVDIFRQEGATNAKFVWCPNVNYQGSAPLNTLFPGDNYVDYVCLDGYNWGDTNGGFQSFTTIFKSTYDQITAMSSKPVIIGEMGAAEQGGNKASWITNAYGSEVDSMPRIIMVNWFNANKEKDWRVNSSVNSLSAFKNAILQSKYE